MPRRPRGTSAAYPARVAELTPLKTILERVRGSEGKMAGLYFSTAEDARPIAQIVGELHSGDAVLGLLPRWHLYYAYPFAPLEEQLKEAREIAFRAQCGARQSS